MGDHLHGLRVRQRDPFSLTRQADASQAALARWAGDDAVFPDAGGQPTAASPMVPRLPFLPRPLLFCRALLPVRFHTLRRLALLFPFLKASKRQAQPFLHLSEFFLGLLQGFAHFVIFCSETLDFFLLIPGFPCLREVKPEQLPGAVTVQA
jgi:hypothetical protein